MKLILLIFLLPIATFGPAQTGACKETIDKTIKVIVKPDSVHSTRPITEALKAFKPGFNLIIEVQSGTYRDENGIAIDNGGICLLRPATYSKNEI